MATVTTEMIKELRSKTGAGLMDCKKALQEKEGNIEQAVDYLKEKGLVAAAKKEGRVAAEGLVDAYIHMGGRIGVLLEVNCETDFVAKTEEFKQLVKDIAMHIAAIGPEYVSRDEVPQEVLEREANIFRTNAQNEGKPEKVIDKIVQGRVDKFLSEICLMEQGFVKDPDVTVESLIKEKIAKIGENISVRRFVRYERGAGLEKRQDDFVAEVMSQVKK